MLASHSSHSSHASHSSHSSHYSGRGGGGGGGDEGDDSSSTVYTPPPPPPKPARISILARPGGQIFVDGKAVGRDATTTLILAPGSYTVRVANRFLGDHTVTISLDDGQTGVVELDW
ncbi:MAG TPA: PEGA domain-containing protein [Kofleriaceae bacterium]